MLWNWKHGKTKLFKQKLSIVSFFFVFCNSTRVLYSTASLSEAISVKHHFLNFRNTFAEHFSPTLMLISNDFKPERVRGGRERERIYVFFATESNFTFHLNCFVINYSCVQFSWNFCFCFHLFTNTLNENTSQMNETSVLWK